MNANSPAERNKWPIFEQLTPLLQDAGRVLEVGAGNGTHARHAIGILPGIRWQPTEQPDRVEFLQHELAGVHELPEPVALDATGEWPSGPFDVVYAANVSHIMGWPAVEALFAGSGRVLAPDGLLCLYGPFIDDAVATAPSNLAFDRSLRSQNPAMGLRQLQDLEPLAGQHGLRCSHDFTMPANNRLLVWSFN